MPILKTAAHIKSIPAPLPTPFSQLKGVPRGSLTEIYGTPGSGKTQLLLTLATCALTVGNVLLLDADGAIEPSRVVQIHQSNHETCTTNKIRLIRLHTFRDLTILLNTLSHVIPSIDGVTFIAIDSLTTLFRTLNAGEAAKRLEALAWKVRQVAINFNCAVVLTNHARAENGQIISAMGDSWRHICGTRLCTKLVSGERFVSIVKSPIAQGDINVDITESGVNVS